MIVSTRPRAFIRSTRPAVMAGDEQHWITVHPNGDDEGQPVLIEGSAGGGYTIIGGAGGKLNGKSVSPKSMSKGFGHRDHEEASKAAHAATEHANKEGTAEAHEAAAGAHANAKSLNDTAGQKETAEEHGKQFAHHKGEAAKASEPPKSKSELADEASAHAATAGTIGAHHAAAEAHAKAFNDAVEREDEAGVAKHNDARKHHEIEATKLQLPGMMERADAASAKAHKEKTALAHSEAMEENYRVYKALVASNTDGGLQRVYANEMDKHREAANKANKREKAKAAKAEFSASDAGKTVSDIEKRYTKASAAEIKQEFHERFGLHFENGSNAYRDYKKASAEHRKNYFKMTIEERTADRERVRELANKAGATLSSRVSGHTEYDIDDGSTGAKNARATIGHVAAALEHMESLGFDVKAALSRGRVAFQPGSTGKFLGHAFQRNGTGYFSLTSSKRDAAGLLAQTRLADARREAGKPRWSVSSENPAHSQMATTIHELAHALGLQPHINSPNKLGAIFQTMFPVPAERHNWIKNNISEYGASKITETDAELAALVTSPAYVRGTLPKVLEDHVDDLFAHKSRSTHTPA